MIDLFQNINNNNKEKILRLLEANTLLYKKNTTILSNFNNDNIIGIVVSGYIHITKTDYNGNVIIIEELEENSVFGTSSCFTSGNECTIVKLK